MVNYRIYQYTSIGRPLDPAIRTNRVVLLLLPVAAVLGCLIGWYRGGGLRDALLQGLILALILYVSWALARELDPDDNPAAFLSLCCGLVAAMALDSPGILIPFVALGLVRVVNRSTGLAARQSDSFVLMLLSVVVIYATESPFFGAVAALAFILDGTLKNPLRRQWVYGLVCFGATVVYMVDHDIGLSEISAPDSLFEWLSVLFLLIFALDILLTRSVSSLGDVTRRPLDAARVRGGMVVGLCAALQGVGNPQSVVVIVAVVAGICIGMAFRKGFRAPVAGQG